VVVEVKVKVEVEGAAYARGGGERAHEAEREPPAKKRAGQVAE
jgi:hypothetical protein